MPELPEVEVLARHLAGVLPGRRIREVTVHRPRSLRPDPPGAWVQAMRGAGIRSVQRRGKYLVFGFRRAGAARDEFLLGHLGMTGRLYLQPADAPLPRHVAIDFDLGEARWVFEDPRYFGRFTLRTEALEGLGPEPLDAGWTAERLGEALRRSGQAVKVRLMDQRVVAGLGNIYASEALFVAGIAPGRSARRLRAAEVSRLRESIRSVLEAAIGFGSTLSLNLGGRGDGDGLFYYGRTDATPSGVEERLWVYDREGRPCRRCGRLIRRVVQSGRSTFFCSACQR